MPDTKITALTAISTVDPAVDVLPIVDVSDTTMAASGTTKKITSNQILGAGGTATLASATITGDLTVDTSTLKVDSANNRVGIVTASPRSGFALDVLGNAALGDSTTGGSSRLTLDGSGTAGNVPMIRFRSAGVQKAFFGLSGGFFGDTSTDALIATDAAGAAIRFCVSDTGTEAMRLNSTGLGVGVTPSAWSTYKAIQVGQLGAFWANPSGTDVYLSANQYFGSGSDRYIANGLATIYKQNAGVHSWLIAPSGTAGNAITFTQAMTLDASGNLLVGTTSALIASSRRLSVVGTVAAALQSTGAATVEAVNVWHTATTGNNIFIDFDTEASVTSRGSISYNRSGGLVAYNTTSDYRAKDIIGPVSNSGSVIDSLKVYIGKMKGASVERPMLVAHEAQTVAPYAVTGEKDAVDVDGNPRYQQMDVSSFVPLLIAEIQSLRTRVAALEA